MAMSTFSIRMDNDLKERFTNICESMGMSMSTAFNIFASAVVDKKRIPFDIEAPKDDATIFMQNVNILREEAKKKNLQKMSLDQINDIINETRKEMKEHE